MLVGDVGWILGYMFFVNGNRSNQVENKNSGFVGFARRMLNRFGTTSHGSEAG
jgi:hypothetical protein